MSDLYAAEPYHIQCLGDVTACGKQIGGGLFKLKTLPLEVFKMTSHIKCNDCRKTLDEKYEEKLRKEKERGK